MKDPLAMARGLRLGDETIDVWMVGIVTQRHHHLGIEAAGHHHPLFLRSGDHVASSKAAQEVAYMYIRQLLIEIGFPPSGPTPLGCDNKGARDTAYNPEHHERMKHVEHRHLYVRECIERGEVVVPYVRTCDNLADFFIKCLTPAADFFPMRDKIMNINT